MTEEELTRVERLLDDPIPGSLRMAGLARCLLAEIRRRRGAPERVAGMDGGDPRFLALLDEMRAMHLAKSADYGRRGVDPLANLRASQEFGIPSWVGAMLRANDKVTRIKSFILNGELKNESVEDSLKDLAAYALLALVLFREQEGGAK